jgi:hypothetical protein
MRNRLPTHYQRERETYIRQATIHVNWSKSGGNLLFNVQTAILKQERHSQGISYRQCECACLCIAWSHKLPGFTSCVLDFEFK